MSHWRCLFFVSMSLAATARAQPATQPAAAIEVDVEAQSIVLTAGDVTYNVQVTDDARQLLALPDSENNWLTVRDPENDDYMSIIELTAAEMVVDEPERKVVRARFQLGELETRERMDAEAVIEMEVSAASPALLLDVTLINHDVPWHRAQAFWGWLHGKSYGTPDGPQQWAGEYANIPPAPWLYLEPAPRVDQMTGRGLITDGHWRETPFRAVVVMATRGSEPFAPGDRIDWRTAIFPADSPDDVEAVWNALRDRFADDE